ncbi:oligosaccharide flippase family protein [Proteus alimentorum]|uniref:Oligosaccharide flippase family protein n=1 Tax=Proteus alimentorum TaxID=1973495 RepID=A0ABS0IQP1_9GAMM|nr:oligosaccharide flippase family protein [Proteus alimentorum]MBG2875358.1 oligosaccharide flippase family protein [Proteus alimentorum]MBG2878323.1 oligosaccharide flippase family protein [Proteus alimentorum]
MKKLTIDIIYKFSQGGIKHLLQLIILFYGTYQLGSNDFGQYVYITTIIITLSLFLDFGLSTTLMKEIAENKENENKIYRSIIPYFSILTLSAGVIFLTFSSLELNIKILLGLTLSIMPLCSVFDGVHRGKLDFKINAKYNFFAAMLCIILAFPIINHFNMIGLLFLNFIFYFSLLIQYIYNCRKNISSKIIFDGKYLLKVASYSVIIGIGFIGQFLYTKADIIILGKYGYLSEITTYEILDRLLMYIILPFGLIAQVLAPRVINSDIRKIKKITNFLFYISIILSPLLYLLSYFILKSTYIYNVQLLDIPYSTYSVIIPLLIACVPIRIFAILQTQALIIPLGFARIVASTTLFFGVINILLDFLLLYNYGFIGIFYSTIIVVSLNTLSQYILFGKSSNGKKLV